MGPCTHQIVIDDGLSSYVGHFSGVFSTESLGKCSNDLYIDYID